MSMNSEVLTWLPVGYMISYEHGEVPNNFIEVDGQRLSKSEYPELFQFLRGTVVDDGEHFVLPTKVELASKFDFANKKIILKIFNG